MDEQIVLYSYDRTLLSNKIVWTIDKHENRKESWNNCVESMKPGWERVDTAFTVHTVPYDSIYIKL